MNQQSYYYPQQVVQQQLQDTMPSCRQLAMQPPQFGPHYPAPCPAVPSLPQAFQSVLPAIANEAANYLSQNAHVNPVYTFFFNVVSQAGYRNSFWENTVVFAGHYAWMAATQKWFTNDRDIILGSAQDAIKMQAAAMAVDNRQLQLFVDPALLNNCVELAQRMAAMIQQFGTLHQQQLAPQQPIYGQVGQGGYQPQAVQPLAWNNTSIVQPAAPVVTTDPMGGGSTVYRHRQAAPQPTSAATTAKYMTVPGEPPKEVSTVIRNPVVEDAKVVIKGVVMDPDAKGPETIQNAPVTGTWRPLPTQLFKPAYDFNHQKLTLVSRAIAGLSGNRYVYIVESKGEFEMDRAAHVITTAKNMYRQVSPGGTPRIVSVAADLEMAAKVLEVTATKETNETTEHYRNMRLVEVDSELTAKSSLIGLTNAARVLRIKEQTDVRSAFTACGSVYTKFITRKAYNGLFELLATLKTFGEVASVLKDHMQREETTEMASLIGRIDRYLTRELLSVIRKRLGLGAFVFDSFIDDIDDVFAVIKKDWGDLYLNALVKFQSEFIQSFFGPEVLIPLSHNEDTELNCCASEPVVSVTLLDVDSDEFGVDVSDGHPHEVFASNFPGLAEFIKAVVTTQPQAVHHYIITDDDVVFEVSKGLIGGDIYLISQGPAL